MDLETKFNLILKELKIFVLKLIKGLDKLINISKRLIKDLNESNIDLKN